MKKKKHTRSLAAIGARLGIFIFSLWFLCMSILTWGTAQYVFSDLATGGIDYAEYALMSGRLDDWFSLDDEYAQSRHNVPGALEYNMNMAIACAKRGLISPRFDGYPSMEKTFSVFNDQYIDCDTAIVFLDKEGNILRESSDFAYFSYIPQNQWEAGADETSACGWIDLNNEADPRYSIFRTAYAGTNDLYDLNIIRITGYMDGSRIEPLAMAFSTLGAYYNALDAASPGWNTESEPGSSEMIVSEDGKSATVSVTGGKSATPPYSVSELDAIGLLEWDERFDYTAQADPTKELVTIYASRPEMTLYEPDGPVRYQTENYDNLLALLKTMGYYKDKGRNTFYSGASQFDLWNMVVFSSAGIYDLRDYVPDGSEPFPDAEYTVMTAMQASPLKIAMSFLRNMYLITFSVALLGFLYINSRVRKHLIIPLQMMNEGIASNWTHISALNEKATKWKEPYELWEHYRQTQDALQNNKNEITRLNTALEYAKTAEQNRRQMTSNIAHELKTPVSSIQGYLETIVNNDNISREKMNTFLERCYAQSNRLSRLLRDISVLTRMDEAANMIDMERVDISVLVGNIINEVALELEEKHITIIDSLKKGIQIKGNYSLLYSIFRNLMDNAIAYAGTNIQININCFREDENFYYFSFSDTGVGVPAEHLNRLFERFYRVDKGRSRKLGGTGLGLAIVKNAVIIHGGNISAKSSQSGGLEFVFTLGKEK